MFTVEDYKKYYEELPNYQVKLDADPLSKGLGSLNEKLADVQGKKDRVSTILIASVQNRQECEELLQDKKKVYEDALENILRTDSRIIELKSEKLRTSAANEHLKKELTEVLEAEKRYNRSDNFYKNVRHIYDNLESVNSNISRQIAIVESMIKIGEIARPLPAEIEGRQVHLK